MCSIPTKFFSIPLHNRTRIEIGDWTKGMSRHNYLSIRVWYTHKYTHVYIRRERINIQVTRINWYFVGRKKQTKSFQDRGFPRISLAYILREGEAVELEEKKGNDSRRRSRANVTVWLQTLEARYYIPDIALKVLKSETSKVSRISARAFTNVVYVAPVEDKRVYKRGSNWLINRSTAH